MRNDLPRYQFYREQLQHAELFENLPEETLDDMLSHFRLETWSKGSRHDSKHALERFYVIIEGRIELGRINPETGKSFVVSILGKGDCYDVLSLLDGEEHDATPLALDDVVLLSASIEKIRECIRLHPEFNQSLMPHLSHCIRQREEIATDLALFDTPTRLARVILRHIPSDAMANDKQNGIAVELLHDLTNEQMAELVGSVRQVINRHLGEMKKEGLIHMDHHQIIVDDLQRLMEKAEVIHGGLQ